MYPLVDILKVQRMLKSEYSDIEANPEKTDWDKMNNLSVGKKCVKTVLYLKLYLLQHSNDLLQ